MPDAATHATRHERWLTSGADAQRAVRALRFVRGGATLVAASDDGLVRRWSCDIGATEVAYAGCAAPVALDVTPDDSRLVAAGDDGEVVLWELASGALMHRWSLDLAGASSPREGLTTDGATAVRCAPDGGVAWVRGGRRAYVLELAVAYAVTRRMRDVTAVGFRASGGETERLWLDDRGVSLTRHRAATRLLTGLSGHALRSESRRTPATFSPRGERLVLSQHVRAHVDDQSLTRLSAEATEDCRADECTVLALAEGLELWATGWRNELSRQLGALSLRVGDGPRARVAASIDLTEPERVTALAITDGGRVAVGTNLGRIYLVDVDLART